MQPSGSTAPRSNLALAECSMWVRRCLNASTRPCFVCGSSGARTSSANLVIPQRTRRSPLFIKKYTLSVANWWCPGSIVAVNGMAFACLGPPPYSRRLLGCSVRGRRVGHSQATTQFLTTDPSVVGYHNERFGGTKLWLTGFGKSAWPGRRKRFRHAARRYGGREPPEISPIFKADKGMASLQIVRLS